MAEHDHAVHRGAVHCGAVHPGAVHPVVHTSMNGSVHGCVDGLLDGFVDGDAYAHMPTHTHVHADGHAQGAVLSAQDRHEHEAEIYDAMAREILGSWSDAQYLVDPREIPFVNREHNDYLSYAVGQLGPLAGKRILEVGVGGGALAVWLAQQGAHVVGLDVSGGILDVARKRAAVNGVAERTTFLHVPVEDFDPVALGVPWTYDAIIGNNVVHHFERDAAMVALGRLLEPDAFAVFCEPVLFVPEWLRALRNSRVVTRRFPLHTHTPDERALNDSDFAIMRNRFRHVQWRPFQLTARLQNFVNLSDPIWDRLESFDRRVLRRFRSTHRLCRIAVVTLGRPRIDASTSESHAA